MKKLLLAVFAFAHLAQAQGIPPTTYYNGGTKIGPAFKVNCAAGMTCTASGTVSGAIDFATVGSGTVSVDAPIGGNGSSGSHLTCTLCVTTTGSQTLINKTLTAPAVNGTVTTSGLVMPTFSMGSQKITSVLDPTSAQDAATKNYVDLNGFTGVTADSPLSGAGTSGSHLVCATCATIGSGAVGDLVFTTASGVALGRLADVAAGSYLRAGGVATAALWSTLTLPNTATANRLLWVSATNVVSDLATANNGALITDGSGVPSISSTLPNAVQDAITRLGTIVSGLWNGTAVAIGYGGTGAGTKAGGYDALSPLSAYADLPYGGASGTGTRLPANASTKTLLHSGLSSGTAPTWSLVDLANDVTGITPAANGGSGVATTSQNFVLAGPTSGSGAMAPRALVAADIPATSVRPAVDSSSTIVWTFDELSGSFANTALSIPSSTSLSLGGGTARYANAGTFKNQVKGFADWWTTGTASIQPANTFSVTVIATPRTLGSGFQDIVDCMQSGTTSSYSWAIYANSSSGGWVTRLRTGGGPTTTDITMATANSLVVGKKSVLGFTYDNATFTAYLDGAAVGTASISGNIFYNGANSFLTVLGDANGDNFDGAIDEVRIDTVARTAAEMNAFARAALSQAQ